MRIEQEESVRFSVFGSEDVFEASASGAGSIMDLLRSLGLYPDDFIVTLNGRPIPVDSPPEQNDYVLYKVPSGG